MGLFGSKKNGKYVYSFDEGKGVNKQILGGKGANLAEMMSLGMPIPDGFTVTTEACDVYYENDKTYPQEILDQIEEKLQKLEKSTGKKLGDANDPLLVSVRSGAAVSMPGMMDTVLNLGLNDESVRGLATKTGNERFALDSYRRFIQMFGDVVMGVDHHHFETQIQKVKDEKGIKDDTQMTIEDLKRLISLYKDVIQNDTGKMFPNDGREQLQMAIDAVFGSWNNDRAISYRRMNDIKGLIGTAVNVQAMVFGNMGDTSGTGVCFTRNPSTGENKFYGEFLMNAQGEDVVAGIRTPKEIQELDDVMPECYKELVDIYQKLEKHYKDMQDMEFTIQEGKLYILQTRNGKRTAAAAVKMAVDMLEEGLIDEKTALLRVEPNQLDALLHKQIDADAKTDATLLTKGLPASPGAAVGEVVFTAHEASVRRDAGHKVILVRVETSPEDIEGMDAAQGILTARGGMTSHAAVVARGMGKCCVSGCGDLQINEKEKVFSVAGKTFKEGDMLTLDGTTGEVFEGSLHTVDPDLSGDFDKLMTLADKYKTLQIKTNSDTPKDTAKAISFGAEGIGLCRTEHMFFEESRIQAVREMIVAKETAEREKALAKIEPFQKQDFVDLFKILEGKPIIVRLIDPPLHEFLPQEEKDIQSVASAINVSVEELKATIADLHEFNPMLGFRGCRLGVRYPEITKMQARAIFKAALEIEGAKPWIEVPLIGNAKEYMILKNIIEEVAEELGAKGKVDYKIGSMVEVPRAAITADEFAGECDFLSFGTNDLTQMGCGFSRDDSGAFLKLYVEKGIYDKDPFQALDQQGVGKLMQICIEKAKGVNPGIHMGICGEHGGEPSSVEFCHNIGLNEVSCSPYRVPIAKLAAAQAAIKNS
ncbi:MAG TPA: pyruvate, phosphate dikinase [Candidatus Absconditabacterales bacterium]|nr:pyruvate, phosphate dikinase [Candidatus Absconditabacterales bacterium]